MNVFSESEWGNTQVFSYYPGSSEFSVSSSVLDVSLQKVQKKNKDCKQLQPNKKRKRANEESTEQKKKKKQKPMNDAKLSQATNSLTTIDTAKGSEDLPGKLSNSDRVQGPKNASSLADSSSKKKKKKINATKDTQSKATLNQTNSLSSKSITEEEKSLNASGENEGKTSKGHHKNKKKKKSINKRNKYKELNIEQNKKKVNSIAISAAEIPLKEKRTAMLPEGELTNGHTTNESSGKCMKKKRQKTVLNTTNVSQSPDTIEKSVIPHTHSKEDEETTEINGTSISKAGKKKKKKALSLKTNLKETLNSDPTSSIDKLGKTAKTSKVKQKKKALKTNMEPEKEVESKTKTVVPKKNKVKKSKEKVEFSDVNPKGKVSTKKGKKKKSLKSKEEDLTDSDNELEDFDGEDADIHLKNDLEAYLKELNFDKLKGKDAVDVCIPSDEEEWETDENNSTEESETEDVAQPDEKIEIRNKTVIAVKNPNKNCTQSAKLIESTSNEFISKKRNEKPQSTPVHATEATKEKKFKKDILNKMLQEADRKEKKALETTPRVLSAAEALRHKMTEQLSAAKFRLVNEKMYTTSSSDAAKMFRTDPNSFSSYHSGFQAQVARWPMNPLDIIIKWLKNKPKHWVVADFGCGEATLAESIPQEKVHSIDFVAVNSRVTASDMAHTPLKSNSVNVVVFCLALMGTNIKDFILEANRVLHEGGIMKIAEVESRFNDANVFVSHIKKFGFHCTYSDTSQKYFYMFEFKKNRSLKNTTGVPNIILKPCKYKKR